MLHSIPAGNMQKIGQGTKGWWPIRDSKASSTSCPMYSRPGFQDSATCNTLENPATIMPKKENLKLHHVSILESSDCSWTSFDSSRRKCVPSLRLSQQKAQCCASRRVRDFGLHCLHQLQSDCCFPSLTKCSVAVHFNADSSAVAWPMNANQHIPRTKLWGKSSLLIAKRRVFTWNFGQCQQSHKHYQDPQTVTYCDHERHTCGYLWQLVPLLLLPLF